MKKTAKKSVWKILAVIAGICALAGVLGLAAIYSWAVSDLPNFTRITDYRPALVTTVYAKDNSIMGYFYHEKRFLAKLENMPPYLPLAFLAAEDDAFYEHDGVDLKAIFRAFMKNVQAGGIRQGGSTITQQVVKSLLLTSERSYERKLKEAILAYRLERYLNKDEILTIYLNQIYLGAGAYGVEAAARNYFGKHVNELSLAEAAILGGLPQAPSRYNPYQRPTAAYARQHYVLHRMQEMGWITKAQHDDAVAEKLVFRSMPDNSWKVGSWYLEEVRRRLIEDLSEENMRAKGIDLPFYGEQAVYEAGLHVYTNMDPAHQLAAENSVKAGLEASTKRRGWRGAVEHIGATTTDGTTATATSAAALAEENAHAQQQYLQAQQISPENFVHNSWQKVLVTKVTQNAATVRFGEWYGIMPVKTMHWARTPDPKVATDHVPSIKDARLVLKEGDVVWAHLLLPADLPQDYAVQMAAYMAEKKARSAENAGTVLPPLGLGTKQNPFSMALTQKPLVQGALVSLEPATGAVLALVGGYDFSQSQYNRAVQAKRQPGSSFKPIVYSTAIDNGYTPASTVLDAPFVYTDQENDLWRPENFEGVFYGPTLLRTALVKSRNLCTIRIAQQMGISKIIERAEALGLEGPFPQNLAVSLGAVAVSPVNLSEAYTAFANGGKRAQHQILRAVRSAWDEPILDFAPQITEAMSPQTAYIMASLMKEVVRDGTGFRAKVLKRPVGGKTGTSNDEKDAWFVLISPYLVTVSYVGFDQLEPMGKWETGSRAASPLVVEYRKKIEDQYPVQDFPMPAGIVQVRIDAQSGLLAGEYSEKSYFVPFKAGTEPVHVQGAPERHGSDSGTNSEDLLRQMF